MKKWIWKDLCLLAAALAVICLLQGYGYEKELLEDTSIEIGTAFEEAYTENRIVIEESDNLPKGELGKVILPYLQPGNYLLEADYQADLLESITRKDKTTSDATMKEPSTVTTSTENILKVYLPEAITQDNKVGMVIASQNLPVQNSEAGKTTVLRFELKEEAYHVEISLLYGGGSLDLKGLKLRTEGIAFTDSYVLAIIFFSVFLWFLWVLHWNKKENCKNTSLVHLFAIAMLVSLPCILFGVIDGHDVSYHLARIEGVYRGILVGEVPLRINSVQLKGYGYLSGIMYPQLFLYIPALLRVCGVSLMTAYQLFLVLINLGTAVCMYKVVVNMLQNKKTAMWAAFLYTLSPYRLLNLYTRGALGETLAMIFLPLVFWGVYEVLWGNRKRWVLLTVGLTGVVQSHVLSVELAGIIIGITGVVWLLTVHNWQKFWKSVQACVKAGLLFLGCNLFFFLPFVYYSRAPLWIFRLKGSLHDSGAYLSQIFNPFIQAGGENLPLGSLQGEMSFGLGLVFLMGILLFAVGQFSSVRETGQTKRLSSVIGWFCMGLGMLCCLMSTNLFPWEWFQQIEILNALLSAIQFPWRFLGTASFFFSIMTACALAEVEWKNQQRKCFTIIFFLVTILTMLYYYNSVAEREMLLEDKMAVNGTDFTDYLYLYGPIEEEQFTRDKAVIQLVGDSQVVFENYHKEGSRIQVDVKVAEYVPETWLILPLYSYWGYEAKWDYGSWMEAGAVSNKVAVPLQEQSGHLEIRFVPHITFRIADMISLLTALGSMGYLVVVRRRGTVVSSQSGLRI